MTEPHQTITRSTPADALTDPVIIVVPMPIWQQIGVRCLRVYLQSFLGLLGADALDLVDVTVGEHWTTFFSVAAVATAPAFVTLCHNALEFLTELDVKRPTMRA